MPGHTTGDKTKARSMNKNTKLGVLSGGSGMSSTQKKYEYYLNSFNPGRSFYSKWILDIWLQIVAWKCLELRKNKSTLLV